MIFPEYDNQCGWYETLENVSNFDPVEKDSAFKSVIIGGGFVGVAAARRLAENEPQEKTLLLDALKIGQGASGRNSGFIIDQPHKRDLESGDRQYKQKVLRLNRTAISYLEKQIKEHGIQCQWSLAGKYQAAVGQRGERYLSQYERLLQDSGEPYKRVKRDQLEPIFGTRFYSAAIFTPGAVLMQPAALMRGLADSMPSNVTVAERTPVVDIRRDGPHFVVVTDQAEIRCHNIILATNAFTAEFGYMRDRILPVMTFASWTRPLTNSEMQQYGGQLDWGITPADHAGTTLRMTQDRRILIRNSHRYAYDYNTPKDLLPRIRERHHKSLIVRYPSLSDIPLEHTWGGTGSMSSNYESFFGQLEPGVYSAGCDQLVGAARGTISGMMLGDLIAGRSSADLSDMHSVSGNPAKLPHRSLLRIGVPLRMHLARLASRTEV